MFRNTTAYANADALSRLLLQEEPVVAGPPLELVLLAEHLADSPVTADYIRQVKTTSCPECCNISNMVGQVVMVIVMWKLFQRDWSYSCIL